MNCSHVANNIKLEQALFSPFNEECPRLAWRDSCESLHYLKILCSIYYTEYLLFYIHGFLASSNNVS